MTTITISLPNAFARQIDHETVAGGFATRSEFVRALLRRYFTRELELEVFNPQPIANVKLKLAATGKYSQKFIKSVTQGLTKSSPYVR